MKSTPDDDFKLVETLRNKNEFNIPDHHCFVQTVVLEKEAVCFFILVVFGANKHFSGQREIFPYELFNSYKSK